MRHYHPRLTLQVFEPSPNKFVAWPDTCDKCLLFSAIDNGKATSPSQAASVLKKHKETCNGLAMAAPKASKAKKTAPAAKKTTAAGKKKAAATKKPAAKKVVKKAKATKPKAAKATKTKAAKKAAPAIKKSAVKKAAKVAAKRK